MIVVDVWVEVGVGVLNGVEIREDGAFAEGAEGRASD